MYLNQGGNFSLRPTQKPLVFESAQPFESVDFQNIQSQQSNQETKKIDFDFTIFKEPQKEISESQISDEQDMRFSFVQIPQTSISQSKTPIKVEIQTQEMINKSIQVNLELSRKKDNEKYLLFLKSFLVEDLQMMTHHLDSCKKKIKEHIEQEEQISESKMAEEYNQKHFNHYLDSSSRSEQSIQIPERKRVISGIPQIDIVEKALTLTQQGSTQKLHEISSQNLFNIVNYTSEQTTFNNQSTQRKQNQIQKTQLKNSDDKEKQLKYENSYKQLRENYQVPVRVQQKKQQINKKSTSRSPSKNNSIYKSPTPQKSPRPQNIDQSKLNIYNKNQTEQKSPLHLRVQTQPEKIIIMNKNSNNTSMAYQSSQKEERSKPKLISYSSKQHIKTSSQNDVISKKLTPNKLITTAKKQPQSQSIQGPQYIKLDFTKIKKVKQLQDQRSDISYLSNQTSRQHLKTDEPFLKIELTLDDLLQNYDESLER